MTFSVATFSLPHSALHFKTKGSIWFPLKITGFSSHACICRKYSFKEGNDTCLSLFPGFASVPVKGGCSSYSSLAWAFQTRCSLSAPWTATVEQCRKSSFFNTCESWVEYKLLTVTNRRGKENNALGRHSNENLCILTFLYLLRWQWCWQKRVHKISLSSFNSK